MSMQLDAADLRVIADKLEALQAINGVNITQIAIDNGVEHYIYLKRQGDKYVVQGITDKVGHKPVGTVYREG